MYASVILHLQRLNNDDTQSNRKQNHFIDQNSSCARTFVLRFLKRQKF